LFSFNPALGPGYVWHCHIVDHEDNEMMRPFKVIASPFRSTGIALNNFMEGYSLEQNIPNPFKIKTEIRFRIPVAKHVVLKLLNYMGQEVQTLIDSNVPAGNNTAILDAQNLSGGLYFYQLKAGDYSATKKLIINN